MGQVTGPAGRRHHHACPDCTVRRQGPFLRMHCGLSFHWRVVRNEGSTACPARALRRLTLDSPARARWVGVGRCLLPSRGSACLEWVGSAVKAGGAGHQHRCWRGWPRRRRARSEAVQEELAGQVRGRVASGETPTCIRTTMLMMRGPPAGPPGTAGRRRRWCTATVACSGLPGVWMVG